MKSDKEALDEINGGEDNEPIYDWKWLLLMGVIIYFVISNC